MPLLDIGVTEGDLLAELTTEYRAQFRQPGEFTAQEFLTEAKSGTIDSARDFLEAKVAAGELTKRENVITGRARATVYKRAVK